MDAPIWSNDLLYLRELIIIMTITVVMIGVCFYFSKRADGRRALRAAHAAGDGEAKPTTPAASSQQGEKR